MLKSTAALKDELNAALGQKAEHYWSTLNYYLSGQISRAEFDDLAREALYTPNLVNLHNALLISIIGSSSHHAPPTPPPDGPGKAKPARKRRRMLPYQGMTDVDDQTTLRSPRLKRWIIGVGRKERERLRALEKFQFENGVDGENGVLPIVPHLYPNDEIASERGVILLPEGKDPPGTYVPIHLASVTRAPTFQHISERIALISAQHNLGPPTRSVASLMMLAYQAKLKQLISQAISLTSVSSSISSIQTPSSHHSRAHPLSASAFDALFTLRPAVLPNKSAAAMRLAVGENNDLDHEVNLKDRHVADPRWQLLAMLADRSTIRDTFRESASSL